MHRRVLLSKLGTIGIAGLAGCASSADEPPSSTETTLCGAKGTTTSTSSADTTTSTDTPTADAYTDLIVESATMTTINTFLYDGPAVDATITNKGNAPTELFEITVDWLDSSGEALDSTGQFMNLLNGGETWRARIPAEISNPSKVEDYDLFVPSANPNSSTVNPEGITVVSTSVTTGDDEYVRGELKNERNSAVEYLEAIGKVYDNDGRVLVKGSDITETLRAGDTWRTQMSVFSHGRAEQIEEGSVTPIL